MTIQHLQNECSPEQYLNEVKIWYTKYNQSERTLNTIVTEAKKRFNELISENDDLKTKVVEINNKPISLPPIPKNKNNLLLPDWCEPADERSKNIIKEIFKL